MVSDEELADKINKMTKKDLINLIFNNAAAHKNEVISLDKVMDEVIAINKKVIGEREGLKKKITRLYAQRSQAEAMIMSIIDSWD